MILSGNSIEHLLMLLGAYTAGVPVVPLSTAYSLLSRDHERVARDRRRCARPGMVFADDGDAFGAGARRRSPTRAARVVARERRPARSRSPTSRRPTAPGRRRARVRGASARTRSRRSCSPRARPARRRACINTAPDAVLQPAGARPGLAVHATPSRRCSSTGCRGATRSAATTTSTRSSRSAARCTSTTAARRPRCSTARSQRCARSRPTVYFNVPAGYALLAPRLEADARAAPRRSSRGCGSCSTPPPRCRRTSGTACERVADEVAGRPGPADRLVGHDRDLAAAPRRRTSRSARCGVHRRPAARA